jgi:hypothetical protein
MQAGLRIGVACAVFTAATAALSGCYQSPGAKTYTPGVYKGAKDPLVKLSSEPDHERALRERFDLVQRDR